MKTSISPRLRNETTKQAAREIAALFARARRDLGWKTSEADDTTPSDGGGSDCPDHGPTSGDDCPKC